MGNGMYFDKPFSISVLADNFEVASLTSDCRDRLVYTAVGGEAKVYDVFYFAIDALIDMLSDVEIAKKWANHVEVVGQFDTPEDISTLIERFADDRQSWSEGNYVSFSHWFE